VEGWWWWGEHGIAVQKSYRASEEIVRGAIRDEGQKLRWWVEGASEEAA